MTEQDFIKKIAPIAIKDMQKSGVLASVTIAQGFLESGHGTEELALKAKNFFGMKCSLSGNTWKSVWDGKSKHTKKTKEQTKDGKEYTVTAAFRKYPDMETSVRDHSLYLTGAKNGSKLRFTGLAEEKDPRKAITIIKNGGYATDTKYVDKVMSIINRYNLTQYDKAANKDSGQKPDIQVISKLATKNKCYKNARKIAPKGIMLHSVGCPQPDPLVFAANWDKAGQSVCVHLVVGKDPAAYQLLPFDVKANHCGSGAKGSGNNAFISLEMTEPATIKYTGGSSWIELGSGANTKAHVMAVYANAVQVFSLICKQYSFDPLDDNVIMSHQEGHKKGIASNHGDVGHLWDRFGLTMEQFRQDVKAAVDGTAAPAKPMPPVDALDDTSAQKVNPLDGTVTVIYKGFDGLNIRKAPSYIAEIDRAVKSGEFKVVGISADEKWYKLEEGLFITAVPKYVSFKATPEQKASTAGTGYYRVRKSWEDADSQIGAFKDKNNAINLCKNNSGYRVYDDPGNEIYPLNESIPQNGEFKVRVSIPNLRIRKGAGTTYDYHRQGGKAVYTGKGEFTIVETMDGPGASLWGLLKSYESEENGWIALDEWVKICD